MTDFQWISMYDLHISASSFWNRTESLLAKKRRFVGRPVSTVPTVWTVVHHGVLLVESCVDSEVSLQGRFVLLVSLGHHSGSLWCPSNSFGGSVTSLKERSLEWGAIIPIVGLSSTERWPTRDIAGVMEAIVWWGHIRGEELNYRLLHIHNCLNKLIEWYSILFLNLQHPEKDIIQSISKLALNVSELVKDFS